MTGYVHLKTVHDGLAEKPWRYLWSSCMAYVESDERGSLVDSETVLARLAKNRLKQSVLYLKFIKDRTKAGWGNLPPHAGIFIGGPEFAETVGKITGELPRRAEASAAAATAKAILAEVLQRYNLDEERLFGRNQWRELSAPRREAVYRIWKEARIGVTELGRMFNRTPSAISQLIRAVETAPKAGKVNN
jgi:hypothetical protein